MTKRFVASIAAFAIALSLATIPVQAHLMVEQQGTINFKNGGAFLVLSVPVSAFADADEDSDGALSESELARNAEKIKQHLQSNVRLLDDAGEALPLQGLMLSLAHPDDAHAAPAKYVVALGRFLVEEEDAALEFEMALKGAEHEQQHFRITTTRQGVSRVLSIAPGRERQALQANQ
ncbi:MAG: hypothetical protein WBN34_13120 [Woeseia sp.]